MRGHLPTTVLPRPDSGKTERLASGSKSSTGAVGGADRTKHAFRRDALGGGVMHAELGGDLGGGQPPGPAEMLGQPRDPIGGADVSDPQSGEDLPGPRP